MGWAFSADFYLINLSLQLRFELWFAICRHSSHYDCPGDGTRGFVAMHEAFKNLGKWIHIACILDRSNYLTVQAFDKPKIIGYSNAQCCSHVLLSRKRLLVTNCTVYREWLDGHDSSKCQLFLLCVKRYFLSASLLPL